MMTVSEVSQYLRVHPSTIYKLLKKRELPALKVARDWRFLVECVDEWMKQQEKKVSNSLTSQSDSTPPREPA